MLSALLLAALALDFWFLGLVVQSGRFPAGLLSLAAAVIVFPIGSGVIIDGANRKVIRWWGWVHKPVFRRSHDFTEFSIIQIDRKLGPKGTGNSGRSVSRPLYLVTSNGKRLHLMTCTWVEGAHGLAGELGKIMRLGVDDRFLQDVSFVEE